MSHHTYYVSCSSEINFPRRLDEWLDQLIINHSAPLELRLGLSLAIWSARNPIRNFCLNQSKAWEIGYRMNEKTEENTTRLQLEVLSLERF